jgi:hypothetical protein
MKILKRKRSFSLRGLLIVFLLLGTSMGPESLVVPVEQSHLRYWFGRLVPDEYWLACYSIEVRENEPPFCTHFFTVSCLSPMSVDLQYDCLDSDVAAMKAWAGLKHLSLSSLAITDRSMETIASLTNLRSLSLDGTSITDLGMNRMSRHWQLEDVRIVSTPITERSLVYLQGCRSLKDLNLRNTMVKGLPIERFAGRLKSLDLSGTPTDDESMQNIRTLSLMELKLCRTRITSASFEPVSRLANLRVLEIDDTLVGDDQLHWLSDLPRLQWLSASRTSITDAGVHSLASLPSLIHLSIEGTVVTDVSIKSLISNCTLKSLNVSDTCISEDQRNLLERFGLSVENSYRILFVLICNGGVRGQLDMDE